MWATRGGTRQVGRVLPGAGGQRAGSDGAEHDGEDERGQGDGEGDEGDESLISPRKLYLHCGFRDIIECRKEVNGIVVDFLENGIGNGEFHRADEA